MLYFFFQELSLRKTAAPEREAEPESNAVGIGNRMIHDHRSALIVLQPHKNFPKMDRSDEVSSAEFQLRLTVTPFDPGRPRRQPVLKGKGRTI
jgi:hypothetical protein